MTRPLAPPPSLRPTLTDAERAQVQAVVGPADDALLLPLRDARGRAFERLEFLGDSVLDVVMAVHELVEPGCPACDGQGAARLVTDARLGRRAVESGLGDWLEWQAGEDRLADLVEGCAAVAFLAGAWPRAAAFTAAVVHPIGELSGQALRGAGVRTADPDARPPETRRVGAALLELAAGRAVFAHDLAADEGTLSTRRAALHQVERVAAYARRSHVVSADGPDPVVSDRVERLLADELLRRGADAALAHATRVVLG